MDPRAEEIRDEITATRAELAADVDRLAERTVPSRIVRRRTDRVRRAAHSVRERVMGAPAGRVRAGARQATGTAAHVGSEAAEATKSGVQSAAQTARTGVHQAADTVRAAPRQAMHGTQGNPLAAGLIALGAGLVAAAVLPRTEQEERAVGQIQDQAGEVLEPIKEAVRETGRTLAEETTDEIKQAGRQVSETAAEAARTTGREARDQTRQMRPDSGT
ncbi:DUF3618 domain-containing protein [Nonomuraea sp. NPDC005501]|uniref:DUF3618 domain-containing protein n=1 Tax=Nonomuraea sp. NPDC005501 TaxID=3156884 RepID=UPI0033B9E3F5